MPTKVIMPQLGESVIEGTITKWLKAKGDRVEEFEPLLEVNTDKVDTEVPSPAAGIVLDILVPDGATVRAGALLAWIGETGDELAESQAPNTQPRLVAAPIPQAPPVQTTSTPAAPVQTSPTAGRSRDLGFISPIVAKLASEHNIDLFQITGTGQGGRITKKDIEMHIEKQRMQPAPSAASIPPAAPQPVASPTPDFIPGEILPLTTVRRSIADHMVHSKHTSPHVTTIMEVDLSRVVMHRDANKAAFVRDGVNLTFTAYFVAAAAAALRAYPIVNSSWSEAGILLHREINIGMATSLGEAGLIVPVIKHADGLSLLGVARAINDLANRARARQLKPDEVKSGTFTITNHGISGSLFATPIINQPQCGILSVGAIQKRVVVLSDPKLGDSIAIRSMAYLGLTFDHRILDGAIADYFLSKVVELLQNWS